MKLSGAFPEPRVWIFIDYVRLLQHSAGNALKKSGQLARSDINEVQRADAASAHANVNPRLERCQSRWRAKTIFEQR
jgi:hypothetical protein